MTKQGYTSSVLPIWVADVIKIHQKENTSFLAEQLSLLGDGLLLRLQFSRQSEFVFPAIWRRGGLSGRDMLIAIVKFEDAVKYQKCKDEQECLLGGQYRLIFPSSDNPQYEEGKNVCVPIHRKFSKEPQVNDDLFNFLLRSEQTPLTNDEKEWLSRYVKRITNRK